jgi:SEC-C motif-containing protein
MNDQLCPCGSKRAYPNCCAIYHHGPATAPTAEILMRSRYSAYNLANFGYIQATMRDAPLAEFNLAEAEANARVIKWLKLSVISTQDLNSHQAIVEFKAYYRLHGKKYEHHEISEFKRLEDECWYYTGIWHS